MRSLDWDTDGRVARPTTGPHQLAPARPTAKLQMEVRPMASSLFAPDRPSQPVCLARADTLQTDEEIAVRQSRQEVQPDSV